MSHFYVRPHCAGGYGSGDGRSYENAWNGFEALDWNALAACEQPTLWVCGAPERSGFVTVQLEWSYLKHSEGALGPTRPDPGRELTEPV